MFYWSIDLNYREYPIIEHAKQKTFSMNHFHESFVAVLRWIRENLWSSNVQNEAHKKSMLFRRVSFKYWGALQRIFHSRTCGTKTLSMNHSYESSVGVLRWIGRNLWSSNVQIQAHKKSMLLNRVLLKYWVKLERISHCQTCSGKNIEKESF